MKTLVAVSDTHGSDKGLESIRGILEENGYIVHLGDGQAEARRLFSQFPEKSYICAGNCDFCSPLPEEGVLEIEGVRIFYCHGHRYGVKSGLVRLAQEAKRKDCDIALYGHTHEANITEIDGVTLINPGSCRYAVGQGGSYAYLVINGSKYTPVLVGDGV